MPITYNVGQPGTVGPASGGKVWATNNIAQVGVQVVGPNPARTTIVFHNPGASVSLYVYPIVDGNGKPLAPTVTLLGGTFQVFPGGTIEFKGEVQTAWLAFAYSASNNSLTVMESNLG